MAKRYARYKKVLLTSSNTIQEGKTAAIIDGPWKAASLKEAKVNYGVATIPTLPNGKQYSAFGGGKAWVIPAGAKKTLMALKNSLTS